MSKSKTGFSRRKFLQAAASSAVLLAAPTIVPSSVFGRKAPSNRINIGAIGVGRISRVHDMPSTLKYDTAQIIAVCDLDSRRVEEGKEFVNGFYSKKTGKTYDATLGYGNYHDLLANKDVDAVLVSTPDHWHALIGIDAVEAGKDVYLQKPASLTIAEGRALSNAVQRTGRILQIGSQQRSSVQFRYAAELVRNGRIGQLKSVQIGLPGDPSGDDEPEMPVPKNLNYDMWLGSTPNVYYTEKRVHPQADFDRPGWLRCEQFGAGMITGWGAHHVDSAHWGMNAEHPGPVEIWGWAEFPTHGLWDVHGKFKTECIYPDGVHMTISGDFPNGVCFEGTEGWIFVSRGNEQVTNSDPVATLKDSKALAASDSKIITSVIGPDEIRLPESKEHHGNWLESIKSRQQPVAPVEVGHRACSTCLLHHMAMKLKRKLYWDPIHERFRNDDEANAMRSRPMRAPYSINA